MDTLERAMRAALERGNAGDRSYREKVYQSAFAALERALNNPNVSPDSARTRRQSLQQTIARVEREYLTGAAPVVAPPANAQPSVQAPAREQGAAAAQAFEPRSAEPRAPEPRAPQPAEARRSEPRAPEPRLDTDDDWLAAPEPRIASTAEREPVLEPGRREPTLGGVAREPMAHGARREPSLRAERNEPPLDEYRIDADLDESFVGESRPMRRRRRPLAWLFIAVTVLAVLALAAWWVVGSGLLLPASERDGSVPNPSPVRNEEGFDPAAANGDSAAPRLGSQGDEPNAIAIFTPGEGEDFTVPGDAVAQLSDEGQDSALRIRSGRSGSAVAFNVPQEVLQQIAGRRALFVVSAQAEDGQTTQISISCAFGELGDCGGRRRFDVSGERSDVIFDVDLPTVQPGSDGTIAIVSDVSNSGKAVDIFSIRVSAN